MKYRKGPFLRPLRSIDVEFWGCDLKICNHFWKFGCQSWKSNANLCMTNSSKVLIYLSKTYSCKWCKKRYQRQINQNFGTVCHTEVCLIFRGWHPNFQKWLQNFELTVSKFNIDHPLTSMASKTALPYISKIASNQCICSKDWWELWIVSRDRKKTKSP